MKNEDMSIRNLLPRHNQIVDLILEGSMNYKQIAATVGVTPATVRNILGSPTIQHELAVRREHRNEIRDEMETREKVNEVESARRILNASVPDAATKLVNLMNLGEDKIARMAANDILDRGGMPRVAKTDNTNRNMTLVLDVESAMLIKETFELDSDS